MDEYQSAEYRNKDADDYPSPKDKEKDEGKFRFLEKLHLFFFIH